MVTEVQIDVVIYWFVFGHIISSIQILFHKYLKRILRNATKNEPKTAHRRVRITKHDFWKPHYITIYDIYMIYDSFHKEQRITMKKKGNR